jgi:hypothetical protein
VVARDSRAGASRQGRHPAWRGATAGRTPGYIRAPNQPDANRHRHNQCRHRRQSGSPNRLTRQPANDGTTRPPGRSQRRLAARHVQDAETHYVLSLWAGGRPGSTSWPSRLRDRAVPYRQVGQPWLVVGRERNGAAMTGGTAPSRFAHSGRAVIVKDPGSGTGNRRLGKPLDRLSGALLPPECPPAASSGGIVAKRQPLTETERDGDVDLAHRAEFYAEQFLQTKTICADADPEARGCRDDGRLSSHRQQAEARTRLGSSKRGNATRRVASWLGAQSVLAADERSGLTT